MFVVETALKLLFWSYMVYEDSQEAVSQSRRECHIAATSTYYLEPLFLFRR